MVVALGLAALITEMYRLLLELRVSSGDLLLKIIWSIWLCLQFKKVAEWESEDWRWNVVVALIEALVIDCTF